MSEHLTQSEIGRQIALLRKRKGLSQEDLANAIGVSRPSVVQIESGRRSVHSLELYRLGLTLGSSLDDFMSGRLLDEVTIVAEPEIQLAKRTERVSAPKLDVRTLKHVLLYGLEKCAAKPNAGEAVLSKLLYFSDFNYFELYEEHLTGAAYRKLPFGPVPDRLDAVLAQMIKAGQLYRLKADYHGHPQVRYVPLEKPDLTLLKASEKAVIDRVDEQMGDWSAAAITAYAHRDIPWEATEEGRE